MQRLFSTFADGWPGAGLLVQRFLVSAILLHRVFLEFAKSPHMIQVALPMTASLLLLIGLGTPYVGLLVAATQFWFVLSGAPDPWTAVIVSALAASLAMIGPGAWSVDALVFGRKHFEMVKK